MAEPDIARIFENLGRELSNVSAYVGTQSISQVIQAFNGEPGEFKLWIKSLEKFGVLNRVPEERLKLVAYQSSKNSVSDFINRHLRDHTDSTWDEFHTE
jgi:hypothetical protein